MRTILAKLDGRWAQVEVRGEELDGYFIDGDGAQLDIDELNQVYDDYYAEIQDIAKSSYEDEMFDRGYHPNNY